MSAISSAVFLWESLGLFEQQYARYVRGVKTSTGELLRAHREQAKVSLREVARRAKLSAAFVSDVELGRRSCPSRLMAVYNGLEWEDQK